MQTEKKEEATAHTGPAAGIEGLIHATGGPAVGAAVAAIEPATAAKGAAATAETGTGVGARAATGTRRKRGSETEDETETKTRAKTRRGMQRVSKTNWNI